jgi:DNA-binding response OmpR family regulator
MNSVLVIGDDSDYVDIRAHGLILGGIQAVPLGIGELEQERITHERFDIVILDVYLAETDIGLVCRQYCTEFDCPILVLSYERDERIILDLYSEGIADYIIKPIGTSLVVAKVTSWLHHISAKMVPHRHVRDGFRIDASRRIIATPAGDKVYLSKLEYHLFELLYSNRGRVLSTDLLIDRIWGQFEEGDSRLKHLVHRLRRKIEPDPNAPTYIETDGREGYHFSAHK